MKTIISALCLFIGLSTVTSHPHPKPHPEPHLYNYNPLYNYRYDSPYYNDYANYAGQIPNYSPFIPTYPDPLPHDPVLSSYLATPDVLPTLNVLAEIPYAITNKFTVVPMLVVAKENMNMVSNAHIMSVSKKRPVVTIKTDSNSLVQCTPAVRIVLERPITVYSLKTSVLFPSEVQIVHEGYRIPIRVGAIIAPIRQNTYVSAETPVAVNVVYAVPTRPVTIDYVNHNDVIEIPDNQAVVVESEPLLPPPNVTIIDFPDREAEPVLQVDENDDELVNRNPPILLAPAGIVQSTQPQYHVEPFHNSKESPILIALREEAQKRV